MKYKLQAQFMFFSFWGCLVVCLLLSTLDTKAQSAISYDQVWSALQNALNQKDDYLQKKLNKISDLRQHLESGVDASDRFNAYRNLYHMYYDFQIDSALLFADRMLALSKSDLSEQPHYKTVSLILIAGGHAYRGRYQECAEILQNKDLVASLSDEIKPLYFTMQMELHKGLADHALVETDSDVFYSKVRVDLDSLLAYTPQDSVWYAIHLSNKFKFDADYERAEEVLRTVFDKLTTDDREMGNVAYYMSELYQIKGNVEKEKYFLALSAITDVKYAVREYISLWKLALILYNEDDVKKAYQFMEISLQDAIASGAYRWERQITKVFPQVYKTHVAKITEQRNTILYGLFIIVGFMLMTIVLSYFLKRQNSRLQRTKNQLTTMNVDLKLMNEELNSLSHKLHLSNADLQLANGELSFLNNELVAISLLKETYLSKFIEQCSDYIDKLDDYRVNLKRLLQAGRVEKIQSELQSTKYIEKEFRQFLVNFDETFLKLYPNFISEFNSFFPEGEKQEIRKNELLTTELRIFALIRLGITDSVNISKFLRCSITTIYTYRSKIKSKSICPDTFEEKIKDYRKEDYFMSIIE